MGATCYQAILQPCHLTSFGRSWNGLAAADSSSLCEAAHDWCWVRTYPCATCGSPGLSPCGHDVAGSPLGHCVPLPQGNGRPSGANSPLSWVLAFRSMLRQTASKPWPLGHPVGSVSIAAVPCPLHTQSAERTCRERAGREGPLVDTHNVLG